MQCGNPAFLLGLWMLASASARAQGPAAAKSAIPAVGQVLIIGIQARPAPNVLSYRPAIQGLYVTQVAYHGPAQAAGIEPGDVIRSVDHQPVSNLVQLQRALNSAPASTSHRIQIVRQGERLALRVQPIPQAKYLQLLRQLTQQGDGHAAYVLAATVIANPSIAAPGDGLHMVAWLRQGVRAGRSGAETLLGLLHVKGTGVTRDYGHGLALLRAAASRHNAEGEYWLGKAYASHDPLVPHSWRQARYWYARAANDGFRKAMLSLGDMYYFADGVPRDYSRARHLYRRAARTGKASCEYKLGWMNEHGQGGPHDLQRALWWYRLAAGQNYNQAQWHLAVMYWKGRGVGKDPVQTVHWLLPLAQQGNARAEYIMGLLNYAGAGLPRNLQAARTWWTKAAAQGNRQAQTWLHKLPPALASSSPAPAWLPAAGPTAPPAATSPVAMPALQPGDSLQGKLFRLINSTKSEIWHFHSDGTFTRIISVFGFGLGSQTIQSGRYRIEGNTMLLDFQSQLNAAVSGSSTSSVSTAGRQRQERRVRWSFRRLGRKSILLNGHRLDPYTMPD